MRELKLKRTGSMTIAIRIEMLMRHMQYSKEKIQEVLATLTVRKSNKEDRDEEIEWGLLEKKHCEAEMLAKILEEKDVANLEKKSEKRSQREDAPAPEAKEPWPLHKAGEDAASVVPDIPEGCRIFHYTPANASPYWRAELPGEEKHLGKHTRNKSYVHSEGVGSAKVESASARATVVAWLWEWADAKHQAADKAASSSNGAGKKRQKC